jgi:hypothetical protein
MAVWWADNWVQSSVDRRVSRRVVWKVERWVWHSVGSTVVDLVDRLAVHWAERRDHKWAAWKVAKMAA